MALVKPNVGTVKFDIGINAAGYIAENDQTAVDWKTISFKNVGNDGTLDDVEEHCNDSISLLRSLFDFNDDTQEMTYTTTYKVGE